jgi:hypothetical protein
MKRESNPAAERPVPGPTMALDVASVADEYLKALQGATVELANEVTWMQTLKDAYGLDDPKVHQIGRSYSRLQFWEARIAEYKQLLARFQPEPAEVAA